MQNCKSFNSGGHLQKYQNLFHITISLVVCYTSFLGIERNWLHGVKYFCDAYEPLKTTTHQSMDIVVETCFWLYIGKYSDCCERFLPLIRKQRRYHFINFYHVIHHCMMPLNVWMIVKFLPTSFFGFINRSFLILCFLYFTIKQIYPVIKKIFWSFRTV